MQTEHLKKTANNIRALLLRLIPPTKDAHVGSSLSAVEILTALYFHALRVDPKNPNNPDRDRFILSKGHAGSALYATLAERGFIAKNELPSELYINGGHFPGHILKDNLPGIELSTGSLGHGLPVGAGMAFAAKRDKKSYRVFVLMSDGECDEGSSWEAILFAGHHKLDNLTAVVDYNKWQSFGRTKDILDLEPLADKWKSFNWAVREVDGHDLTGLVEALDGVPLEENKPSVLIAHTIKGKGVPSMEDKLESHYKLPSREEVEKVIRSLS